MIAVSTRTALLPHHPVDAPGFDASKNEVAIETLEVRHDPIASGAGSLRAALGFPLATFHPLSEIVTDNKDPDGAY